MATVLRKTDPMAQHLADAVNSLKAQIGAGSDFHLDAYENTVTTANATDLPTSVALVNQMRAIWNGHVVDTLAHKAADSTDETAVAAANPNAGDGGLAGAIALANDLETKLNLHVVSTTYHYAADTVIATAAATDLASLETLANALKTKFGTHLASAPSGHSIRVVGA